MGLLRSIGCRLGQGPQVGQVAQLRRNGTGQRLPDRRRSFRLARLPSSGGIAPLSWLYSRVEALQVGQVAQLRRDGPLSWLPIRSRPRRLVRLPSSGGIVPLSWLEYRRGLQVGQVAQFGRDRCQSVGCRPSEGPASWPGCPVRVGSSHSVGFRRGRGTAGWLGCPVRAESPPVSWLSYQVEGLKVGQVAQFRWDGPLSWLSSRSNW